ncbi:MAG TPA: prepilin peptidase [Candidatus Baltobacteraceae bacterium]|nr:prepilin peptidase [Candidatus Baltobacteraceae bacterium]
MRPIAAIVLLAGLTALLFCIARFWAERYDERVTLRDPIFWIIAGFACILADANAVQPVRATIVLATCAVCAATDRQTGYIFDVVVGSAAAILATYAVVTSSVADAAAGCALCGGALSLPYCATRGRGIGMGDVKLAALIGAGFGVRGGPVAIGAAFVMGAVVALAGLSCGRLKRGDVLRFAPYLAAGSIASLAFYGGL